ncbi:uncharacterized protein OCT59_016327 [Rhizophagus irregularis]|uniref:uncharacterized protein n=1 Tax=Rhizophagus irregularis TaxID=588596 RepID=UPI001A08D6B7|nr:hypothetical protein OCT59_016327 [Rhizophagus irregularis]GET54232.1 hypothetical protein RIR_jg31860.t1 [Rhizophagus irregularis DAOM 181602=DAOM 197198]
MKGEFKRLEGFKRSEELKKTGKESSGDRPWLCKLQYTLNYVVFGDDSYENNFSVNTVNIRTDTDSSDKQYHMAKKLLQFQPRRNLMINKEIPTPLFYFSIN